MSVDPAAWQRLILRSRATLLTRAFVARQDEGAEALFATSEGWAPLALSARGDGCNFGSGARVDGIYTARAFSEHVAPALTALPALLDKLPLADEDKQQLGERIGEALESYAGDFGEQYRALVGALRCRARTPLELRLMLAQLPSTTSPLKAVLREITRNTALPLPRDNPYAASLEPVADAFAALRALAPAAGPATQLDGWVAVLRGLASTLDGRAPAGAEREPPDGLKSQLSPLGRVALAIYRADEDSPKQQLERWLAAANIDSEWWPTFSAPVEEAYALGRRDLQKTLAESWTQLVQADVAPLAETFPFARGAETPATTALIEAALAPKRHFWSTFEAAIAPVLVGARDGWRSPEGRTAPLLPPDLLPTVNRLSALGATLWDKEGKPKPLVVRVRPLPLAAVQSGAPAVLTSYLQVGSATVYGFNQRADWIPLNIEWWHGDSASAGLAIGAADGSKSFRGVTVMDAPFSFWRLLLQAHSDDGRVFSWRVTAPDGRALTVQFELKDDPWTRFALR